MSDNPLQTRPLHNDVSAVLDGDSRYAIINGFRVEPSGDGLGLTIIAPEGKRLSMTDGRFIISEKGRRLEVRCK